MKNNYFNKFSSMNNETNILTILNGAKVLKVSSQMQGCGGENMLNTDIKTIWLSEEGLPQLIIIDLKNLKQKPDKMKCFGLYCWHAYPTNPKLIELLVSKDNLNYYSLGKFDIILKPGTQLFDLDEIEMKDINYMKIFIKEVHGGNRIYINNLFLFEEFPNSDSIIISDSRERNMPRKSDILSEKKNFNNMVISEVRDTLQDLESIEEEKEIQNTKNQKNAKNPSIKSKIMISNNSSTSIPSKNKKIENYNLVSNDNYLLSDSELESSSNNDRKNYSTLTKKNNNPIQESLNEKSSSKIRENKFQIEENTAISFLQKDKLEENELEDHIIKGFNQNNLFIHNQSISNSHNIIVTDSHSINRKENNQSNELNYSGKKDKISLGQSSNRYMYPQDNYEDENYLENEPQNGNMNYLELEYQIKEMQNQLSELNFNTDRMKSIVNINKFKNMMQTQDDIDKLLSSRRLTLDNIDRNSEMGSPLMMSPKHNYNSLDNYLQQSNNIENNLITIHNDNHNPIIYNNSTNQIIKKQNITIDPIPIANFNNDSQDKIENLQNKINTIENDVSSLKVQMTKLTQNIEALLETRNMLNHNNMNFIMDECKKLINNSSNNFYNSNGTNNNLNANIRNPNLFSNYYTHYIPKIHSSLDRSQSIYPCNTNKMTIYEDDDEDNYQSTAKSVKEKKHMLEKNKKLNEKFDFLVSKLEKRIYDSVLKPTVIKLENSLQLNLNEVMIHLKNVEKKKRIQKSKSKEIKKCEKISETIEKLAKKLDRKEKIVHELEKRKTHTYKPREYNISINTFSDSLSEI